MYERKTTYPGSPESFTAAQYCLSTSAHQSTPVSSPCNAECQCTGRNSTLPPPSPSWGACRLKRWVFSINCATSRKSSTVTDMQAKKNKLHTLVTAPACSLCPVTHAKYSSLIVTSTSWLRKQPGTGLPAFSF